MPELPDVEVYRRCFDRTSLHQPIEHVEIEYPRLVANLSIDEVQTQLKERQFESTRRHGKYLFAHLDKNGWLVFHFGMTGFLRYLEGKEDQPEHTGVMIHFANGSRLAYVSQRKLGTIEVTADPSRFAREKELGIDALDDRLDLDRFHSVLSNAKGSIKSALMNQAYIAGIGNIYSDEILFQSRLHPNKPVNELTEDEWAHLYNAMADVLHTAIAAEADPEKMPQTLLLPHRGKGETCPQCGGTVQQKKVAGRTAHFCPHCQKR